MNDPMRKPYTKFIFLTDLHWGYERRSGHKVALHDASAAKAALAFAADFKPDVVVLGGDILDCGPISHHERHKPGAKEGLRLIQDAKECRDEFIRPLLSLRAKQYHYIIGNHERWIDDLSDELPGISGAITLESLLDLPSTWNVVPHGGHVNVGKLTFVHGDTLSGGEHVAKAAVTTYERSIRFGHHHSFQTYTKCSPMSQKMGKTGVLVPCLCHKDPGYLKGKANRWVQGFNYGVVYPDGSFNDTVAIITGGRTWANGKVYA